MKRIRAAAVSLVEKWEAQLQASRGINIQKNRTKKSNLQKLNLDQVTQIVDRV